MKRSQKLMLYSIVGMLAVGIFIAAANASAEELTSDLTNETCDGTGTQQQKRQGNGTGDHPQDGTGNGYKHQYNATLDENGVCIYATEA
ncbi:hypothetical protein NEF87_001701 [Candidatus Lokiarchaeum ossiferum]|uniref:Secreted protein n=1 Tax=Candidatus Lokiarchaeum ossiferum TaxID=2951803 RepID=A0ABY6HPH2_9ARCH|nr:hypothetical protein NEF87_001701 [Candidatus Lokiarchaeum sp. B-35]